MADKINETVVINRVMRVLEELPTQRARVRCFTYILDKLREDASSDTTPAPPPAPDRQEKLPLDRAEDMDPFAGLLPHD